MLRTAQILGRVAIAPSGAFALEVPNTQRWIVKWWSFQYSVEPAADARVDVRLIATTAESIIRRWNVNRQVGLLVADGLVVSEGQSISVTNLHSTATLVVNASGSKLAI